jgi:beta-lactamase class A/beta-lactamase class A VEB
MVNKILLLILILSFSFHSQGESIHYLKDKINVVLDGKDATVSVAILAEDQNDSFSINGNIKLPMQSVFKYHLALAVLDQVDKGSLSLDGKITITKDDLANNLWSPIRKKYPEGATLTLAQVLEYTVAYSDNVGCDILFKIVGGPKKVEEYLHQMGIKDVAIKYDEITQQIKWKRQYENWTTSNASNLALKIFFENKGNLLSPESHNFLWKTMKASGTGRNTIKGGLPKGTVVAHKTGHSGKNKAGLTAAQNDIGIVFLPDGRYFYLSVLVSDSVEASKVNAKMISDISKLTWDYFNNK